MLSNSIGSHIKKLRLKSKMNQKELAGLLNIQRQTVSAYERGVTIPNIYILIALSDIFGVSIDELVGHKAEKSRV